MLPFPGLDRRSEPVLPPDAQDASDLATKRIQLRFGGRPRRQIVEVADLSWQRNRGTANLTDQRANGGQVILEPVSSEAAWFLASEAPQTLQGLFDFRPGGKGRQPNRIEVPGSEASAVPRP